MLAEHIIAPMHVPAMTARHEKCTSGLGFAAGALAEFGAESAMLDLPWRDFLRGAHCSPEG